MNYFRILAIGAIGLGLLASSKPARADGIPTQFPATVCGMPFQTADDLATKTTNFVQQMRIAKAAGDIGGMGQLYTDYYQGFASKCDDGPNAPAGPVFRAVCGYDCHVQLAEFHLFMSSDVAYFAAKGGDTAAVGLELTPDGMAAEVNQGTRIVDSGLTLLGSSVSDGSDGSLRGYLRDVGALNILRAKLYMAQGDAYYQNVSEARIQRLAFLASTSIDQDPAAQTAMTKLAKAGYDAALWGLNEALLEIPDEADFNALYLDAQTLAQELKARRSSLEQGLLFIGIDPDEYKIMDVNDQKTRLLNMATNVSNLEQQIEAVVKSYTQVKTQQGATGVSNQDALSNASISVSTYKAAVIENLADQQHDVLQQKLDAVNAAAGGYDRERAKVDALFTMKKDAMEAQNRLNDLQGTREVEVLQYQHDQVVQQVNELQWIMNQEISKTNLQLQVDGLEASYVGMDRDVAKAKESQQQQRDRMAQANNLITTSQNNIKKLQNDKTTKQTQSGPIFAATAHGLAAGICEVEAKLTRLKPDSVPQPFGWTEAGNAMTCANIASQVPSLDPTLGTQLDYINKRCAMKAEVSAQKIQTTADFLVCIVGKDGISALPQAVQDSLNTYLASATPSTPNVTSYAAANCATYYANCSDVQCQGTYAAMKSTYQEKIKVAQMQADALTQYIGQLTTYRDWVVAQTATIGALQAADDALWVAQLTGLVAAKASADAIPKLTIGALVGFAGGPITLDMSLWMIPKQEADDAYNAAKDIHDGLLRAEDAAKFIFEQRAKIDDINNQITKLRNEYDQQQVQSAMVKFETAQAVMEITGKSLDLASQLQAACAQQQMDVVDCTNSVNDLNAEVAQLQFRRTSLMSQLSAQQQENDLSTLAVQNIDISIANEGLTITNAQLSIDDATIEIQKSQEDIDAIEGNTTKGIIGTRQRAQQQEATLKALIGQLGAQADQVAQLNALKNTLADQTFQASLKLKDSDIAYVQNLLIPTQTSHTDQIVGLLQNISDTAIASDQIKAQMDAAYANLHTQLATEKQNMLSTAEKMYDHIASDQTQKIYLSNEQVVAALTKGIPEYLQEKRRLLQTANYELALLYNKVNALHSTVQANVGIGLASGNPDPVAYVKTGQDLTDAIAGFDSSMFRDQAIIQAQTVSILIPASSGLARQIASERKAEFEINPAAENGKMGVNGYYVLWHDAFSLAQAYTVLDMNLFVATNANDCQRQHFNLYHEGSGFKFYAPGGGPIEPLFFTGAERLHQPKYYISPDGTQSDFYAAWNPTFSLFGFWMGQYHISYDTSSLLPLLGTPVFGTYRVELDPTVATIGSDTPGDCTYEGASFQLLIAYSKIN